MKSSKSKVVWLIGAIVTTLIGVSFSIVGGPAAFAATSNVSFTGTSQVGGATTSWQIGFMTANGNAGDLAAGNTVIVSFNPAFTEPATPAVALLSGFQNCSATASTTNDVVTILLASSGGTCAHAKGTAATLSIAGITNAPVGSYAANTFSVATSKDATAGSPSGAVVLGTGAAAQLAFVQGPSSGSAGSAISPAISVQLQDSIGNAVSTSGVSVTLSVSAGVIDAGATASTGATGRATFSGVIINTAATGLTMTASASGLSSTPASAAFNITVAVGNGAVLTEAATDGGSGVQAVSYYYCVGYTGPCTSSNWVLVGTSTTAAGNYPVTWNAQPANGAYRLVVIGTDKVTNVSQPSSPTPVTVTN